MGAYERSQQPVRWVVLGLACISMLGPYYAYDIPSALNDSFDRDMGLSDTQFNLLYSVYSFPNMVLPFFGGFLVDRFGTNVTLFTFLLLINIGQAIFAVAVTLNSYPLALVGRIFFGFGGESLSVAQSTLLALWFKGKEVAFAMGFNLAIARLGSVCNDLLSPVMYEYKHGELPNAVWFGLFMCSMALFAACALIVVERNAQRKHQETQSINTGDRDIPSVVSAGSVDENGNPLPDGQKKEEPVGEQISLKDVKNFQLSYWLICFSCVVVYAAVLPFNNIAEDLIHYKYGYSTSKADSVLLIIYSISAALSPFLGGLVDRWGKRAILVTIAGATLGMAHLIIGFTSVVPYFPFAIIGCSYAVYAAAIWPSVTYVVEQHQLGTAYGVITAIQNFGLGITPLFVGMIEDRTDTKKGKGSGGGDWRFVELFFASVAFCGVFIGIWLNIVDRKNGNLLNKASKKEPAGTDMQAPLLDGPQMDNGGAYPSYTTADSAAIYDKSKFKSRDGNFDA